MPLTNREAWVVLDAMTDDAMGYLSDHHHGLDSVWRELANGDASSPKLWMDDYLAAFAITEGMKMVPLDKDFKKFEPHGLDLLLLSN